jgi:hypothetical protein
MVVKATVDGSAVRAAIAELKEIDPKLVTALRRDIKSELSGVASGIEAAFPAEGELSGMNGRGRTAYMKPKATVAFLPGYGRAGKASTLIGIKVKIPKESVGAWISEMAGMRGVARIGGYTKYYDGPLGERKRHRLNGQGAYLIDRLNRRSPMSGRGGRYGWKYFNSQKDDVKTRGIRILERAITALNLEK